MTIWLDNHLSPALARWITSEFGEACVQVRDVGLARADDRAIFAAAKLAATALITKDRDFAELVTRLGPPPSIILLTSGNTTTEHVRAVMREMGKAMMGTGEAEGDGRALEAAQKAIANPLLDGVSMAGAKVQAGTVRLRPILMTTATTVLGLIPMALGLGDSAEIRTPMALTVIFGLTSSTVLTLIVIPVIYYGVMKWRVRPRAGFWQHPT